MTSGPSPSARRRSGVRGRGCFLLLVLLIFFGGGFYVGVRATRHALNRGPDWMRHLFGLPSGSAPQTQITVTSMPNQSPTKAPFTAPQAQQPSNPSTPPATLPTLPSNTSGAPAASASSEADLPTQVPQYNDILHRIQDLQHHYVLVQQQAATKTRPQDLQPLLNEQESLLKDMTAAAQRATTLRAQIKADPQFDASYQEAAPCLNPSEVPTRLLNLGLENLRFIEPRSGGDNSNGSDNTGNP